MCSSCCNGSSQDRWRNNQRNLNHLATAEGETHPSPLDQHRPRSLALLRQEPLVAELAQALLPQTYFLQRLVPFVSLPEKADLLFCFLSGNPTKSCSLLN